MSDASSVAATSMSWVQQAQNNPIDFLKSLDDLLDDFGSQELGNAMTQQFMTKFIQAIREMVNDSDLPCAVKDSANALLDAHDAGVKDDCPCSVEASEAVANTQESHAINQSAEATAEALAETANESSSTPASGASSAPSVSPEAQDEAENEGTNESTGTSELANAGGGTQEVADQLAADAGSSGKTKGRSWLEVLAGTLSEIQAKFLDKAMKEAATMSDQADAVSESGEGKSKEFLDAQAQYTATMQLFTIFSNQTSTSIKSIGEALAGISRKQ